ncbi:MAG TPA: ABC transporter permease subunit [Oryzihumus sp.]|nr:ABC transporter permease subunit [Oryzihumus sp.]
MSIAQDLPVAPAHRTTRRAAPVWWLVFRREFVDLWTGGRVLVLLVLFSLIMSVTSVLRQLESQLSLIPPVEMVFLTVLSSITFGLFVGLVIAADSFSGERERATLEPLLLTPVRPRQLVLGKFLAALTPWPLTLLISVPYVWVLGQGDDSIKEGLLLGAMLGGLLSIAFTGLAMVISIWSRSNRTSLFASLLVYLIFLIPTQWPGSAQKGDLGYLVQQLNPLQASSEFLEKVIVNNRTVAEKMPYLMAAIYAAAGVLVVLMLVAAPRLRLDVETSRPGRSRWHRGPRSEALAGPALVLALLSVPAVGVGSAAAAAPAASGGDSGLGITTDLGYRTVNAGDKITFTTVVTNTGSGTSPELSVAMNIVKTTQGEPVDPEDWSPERTQTVDPLAAGEQAKQDWQVNAILEGDYMVYLTVIPKPAGADSTATPVASPGIHLTVKAFEKSNPGGVLPVAIATPVAMAAIAMVPWWRRRRRESAGPTEG